MLSKEVFDEAYVHTHDVLNELGIINGLAQLFQIGMTSVDEIAEIRGIVLGAYRTVGIGGGLSARYVQAHGGKGDEILQAYWTFANESSVRTIVSEIAANLMPKTAPPVAFLEREFDFLMLQGYKIGNLYFKGKNVEAFELWRTAIKGEIIEK